MKYLFFLIFFFVPCIASLAQSPSSSFVPDSKVFNFGKIIEEKGKVSHTFVFTNTSQSAVAIDGIYSGCGCTSFDYTKAPIKPGGTGAVQITYDPYHRPGFFSKEVVVFFNNRQSYTRVWIKGEVTPFLHPVEEDHPYSFGEGVYCSLNVLSFGKVSRGKSKEIKLLYANDTDKEMILTFLVEGNNTGINYLNPSKLAPRERGQVKFTYTNLSQRQGDIVLNIYLCVNGKKLLTPLLVRATEEN